MLIQNNAVKPGQASRKIGESWPDQKRDFGIRMRHANFVKGTKTENQIA